MFVDRGFRILNRTEDALRFSMPKDRFALQTSVNNAVIPENIVSESIGVALKLLKSTGSLSPKHLLI